MNENKVSILLPFYNRSHYLRSAIDSVVAQTYQNWELLLSDNCSTDGSSELAQEYAAKDSRIRYWRNETNIGCGPNYNLCMEKAEGDFIELFGADDILKPECLQKFVDVLANDDSLSLVTSARDVIDSSGQVTSVERAFGESQKIDGSEAIRKLMVSLENWIVAPVMFRTKDKAAGFDCSMNIYADIDYWTDVLEKGNAMYLEDNLFQYRIHAGSRTTEVFDRFDFFNDIVRLVEKKKAYILNANRDLSLSTFIIDLLIRLTRHTTGETPYNPDRLLNLEHIGLEEAIRDCNPDNYLVRVKNLAQDANDLKKVAALALVNLSTSAQDLERSRAELERSRKLFDEMQVSCAWAESEVNKLRGKLGKERESIKVFSEAHEHLQLVSEQNALVERKLRAENEELKKKVQTLGDELNELKHKPLNRIAKLLKK
ncbi:MAG: glycosyltransferase [Candidatus Obscuribacterales bacterium]|nr:glycosyltransferase [Candidatus Obscuribacterales bacterium]